MKEDGGALCEEQNLIVQVGSFEKKHGLPPGTIRNKNGRDTRSDKLIGTIRKENE